MSSDSENEFWGQESASQAQSFWKMSRSSLMTKSSDRTESPRSASSSKKTMGIQTMSFRRQGASERSQATAASRPRSARPGSTGDSDKASDQVAVPNVPQSADSDTENELADVEALIDTESDGSQPPSRGVSFAFSHVESRNGSMTSLSSSASVDSVTGRKRTLEYVNTWNTPIVPIPTPRKSARTTQKPTATSPATADPQTPSNRTRSADPDSPTPYRKTVATPTMAKVCNTFVHAVGLSDKTDSGSGSRHASALSECNDWMVVDSSPQLGAYILAHSREVQKLFDTIPLSWGVQYELARGVSLGWWSWDKVLGSKLDSLKGDNRSAVSKVSQVVLGHAHNNASSTDMTLWSELDREEAAICEGRSRGLGLQGDWMGETKWYGGRIQQVARLEIVEDTFRVVLSKMEMRKSHRFARFLGSRRLLQVSIPLAIVNSRGDDLREFFSQRFVLCGRVFVGFGAKDNKVFLMEVPEDYERVRRVPGDEQRITLEDFVAWHNPLIRNGKQPVSKWATRFDLGFSISVPALTFPNADNVFYTGDELAPHDTSKKPPSEAIYTDGCGYMNGAALSAIARQIGLEERPTAVQGRFAGSKGLWVLHPRDRSPTGVPKIWIRGSQVKIQLDHNNIHPAHRVFDLLAPPRVTIPSRLSRLTILNLAHNGVPTETIIELMKDTLDAAVQPLTQWSGPKAMLLLWKAVDKVGGVSSRRALQHSLGTTRALGITGRIREDELGAQSDEPLDITSDELMDSEELADDEDPGVLSYTSLRDQVTGEPLTIHAAVMDLLQAGFHPLKLQPLREKLKKVVTFEIEDIIRDFHISIPRSAEAFIVPDPCGVLKEGQIHFRSTKNLKDPLEDSNPRVLLGDVLIYRNPNRLPSDVRKVTAVQDDRLAEYTDVIVLPTVGPCSFASILAGGDYDGDVCVVIYEPRLVEGFKNSEIAQMPVDFYEKNFEDQGKIQQVSSMAEELTQLSYDPDARRRKLQESLLSGLSTAPIGQYSKFHENAIYVHGYNAPQTIRTAFMFNTVLDSRKTGYRVMKEVLGRDKREYDKEQPECLRSRKDAKRPQDTNVVLKRNLRLGNFVLDDLHAAGRHMRDEQLVRYDKLSHTASIGWNDDDLLQPYKVAQPFLNDFTVGGDLAMIKQHIDDHIAQWLLIVRETKAEPKTPSKRASASSKGKANAPGSGKSQRAKWDELGRSFAAGPVLPEGSLLGTLGDLELLKASWAYAVKPNFAWKVAFQALCRIKAATRAPVAFTGEFAELMAIPASAGRLLEQSRLALSTS